MARIDESDARHHAQKMQNRLQETMDHLRQDVERVDDPKLKALFETSAEVLGGLVNFSGLRTQERERVALTL
jgi:hypothetical protein